MTEDMTGFLLDQFEILADAPGGVQRLRELILHLAVTGRLGTGDEGDEDAKILITKIKSEIGQKRNLNDQKSPEYDDNNKKQNNDLLIPHNWINVKIGEIILSNLGGGTPPKNNPRYWNGTINWASVKDLKGNLYLSRTEDKITEEGLHNSSSNLIPAGNVIVCTRMGLGKISINTIDVAINQDLRGIFLPDGINILFFVYFFKTLTLVGKGLTVKGISVKELHNINFPLPPLAEQHRIVEKVDSLMALCDDLEVKQTQKHTYLVKLGTGSLNALQQSTTEEELIRWWGHLQTNFGLVFDCVENVEALRQAILQLAVTGRLGTGDERDEDAISSLKLITNDLSSLGVLTDSNEFLTGCEIPYNIPKKWSWTKLGSLLIFGPKNGLSPRPIDTPTNVKSLTLSATTSGKFIASFYKYIDLEIETDSHLWLKDGDILIQRSNTPEYVGKAAIYYGPSNEYIYPDLMMKCRLHNCVNIQFVHYCLNNMYYREFVSNHATGTSSSMKKINQKTVRNIPIPFPPLAEQFRIVEKVNSLMTLCDRLENEIEHRSHSAISLSNAIIQQVIGIT